MLPCAPSSRRGGCDLARGAKWGAEWSDAVPYVSGHQWTICPPPWMINECMQNQRPWTPRKKERHFFGSAHLTNGRFTRVIRWKHTWCPKKNRDMRSGKLPGLERSGHHLSLTYGPCIDRSQPTTRRQAPIAGTSNGRILRRTLPATWTGCWRLSFWRPLMMGHFLGGDAAEKNMGPSRKLCKNHWINHNKSGSNSC